MALRFGGQEELISLAQQRNNGGVGRDGEREGQKEEKERKH
jgi:hypothetical protein